jgi:stage II sporulation protein D
MKFHSLFILLIILTLILAPAAALDFSRAEASEPDGTTLPAESTAAESGGAAESAEFMVKLLRKQSGNTQEIPLEEYVLGALAAEMPASYPAEALKAQSVACRSNAVYARAHPDSSLGGADLSDYSGAHQGYMDEQQRREKWGASFEENEKNCADAVNATKGRVLRYNGKPAFAAFHAISAGMTESAENVWGNDLPYLRPVNSAGDLLAPGYAQSVTVPLGDFVKALAELGCREDVGKITAGKPVLSASGYVQSLSLGGKDIKGTKLRELFALPSAAFSLTLTDDSAVFDCKGLGHGVGMSQFGAQAMAQLGGTWQELLTHYYAGTTVEEL